MTNRSDSNKKQKPRGENNVDHSVAKAFDAVLESADTESLKKLLDRARADSADEDDEAKSA